LIRGPRPTSDQNERSSFIWPPASHPPFWTAIDISDGIPDPSKHPHFQSNSRVNRLFKTPDQPHSDDVGDALECVRMGTLSTVETVSSLRLFYLSFLGICLWILDTSCLANRSDLERLPNSKPSRRSDSGNNKTVLSGESNGARHVAM